MPKIITIQKSFCKNHEVVSNMTFEVIVDDADYKTLSEFSWAYIGGYACTSSSRVAGNPALKGKRSMQQLLLSPLPGFHVHHKNENRLDNRRCNLEILDVSTHLKQHKRKVRIE